MNQGITLTKKDRDGFLVEMIFSDSSFIITKRDSNGKKLNDMSFLYEAWDEYTKIVECLRMEKK